MINARDVAAELGVSVSTIGRAMADDPRISARTKAKVQKAAERLGYIGSNPARIMRGGSSNLLGLMIPDVANDFYASIAQTMSDCVDRQGYRLVLALTRDDRDTEARQIRELVGARAAGIILVPTARPRRELRNILQAIPHVQFLRQVKMLDAPWFGIDDEAAMWSATDHLIELGHRKIAYIGGHHSLSTGLARHAGYQAALVSAGIDLDPARECLGSPTAAFGIDSVERLLESKNPPTAIITGSVHITEGVIETVERGGLTVPGELSLVGFGNASWFNWWRGGLTAVAPPVQDLANSCALFVLDQLAKKLGNSLPKHSSVIRSTLQVRGSTAAPGTGKRR